MKFIIFCGIFLSALTSASSSPSDEPPVPTVRSFGHAGTGCTQGGDISLSYVDGAIRIIFDPEEGHAAVGNGAAPSAQRRACIAQLELTYRGGWQFALDTFEYTAKAEIGAGVSGQVVVKDFFSGVPGIASNTWNIPGPTQGKITISVPSQGASAFSSKPKMISIPPYTNTSISSNLASTAHNTTSTNMTKSKNPGLHELRGSSNLIFGPCGGDAVLNLQMSVALQQNVAGGSGSMWMDRMSARLVWQKC